MTPIIEVIDDTKGLTENENNDVINQDEEEEFDWQVEQVPNDESSASLTPDIKYGFANLYSGVFARFRDEIVIELDIQNPDSKSAFQRHEERLQTESNDFSDDHYLADYFEDNYIEPLLDYKPSWSIIIEELKMNHSLNAEDLVSFSDDEKEKMRKLPRKEYLLDSSACHSACLGLVDIVFAYAYYNRTSEGEHNVEAGWTITKLSPTLSWFETHQSVEEAIVGVARRALCYPLYRNWNLIQAVLSDTKQLFQLGRKQLLKCLLDIHAIFIDCDSRYILNDLYITDYCVWIQHIRQKRLSSLANKVQQVKISKKNMNFDLEELEAAGHLVQNEAQAQMSEIPESSTSGQSIQTDSRTAHPLQDVCATLKDLKISESENHTSENIASTNDRETLEAPEENQSDDDGSSSDNADYYLDSDDISSQSDSESKE